MMTEFYKSLTNRHKRRFSDDQFLGFSFEEILYSSYILETFSSDEYRKLLRRLKRKLLVAEFQLDRDFQQRNKYEYLLECFEKFKKSSDQETLVLRLSRSPNFKHILSQREIEHSCYTNESLAEHGYCLLSSYQQMKTKILNSECEENLRFLIDIHNYEKIWNLCFEEKFNSLTCQVTGNGSKRVDSFNSAVSKQAVAVENTSQDAEPVQDTKPHLGTTASFHMAQKANLDVSSIVDIGHEQSVSNKLYLNSSRGALFSNWEFEFEKKQLNENSTENTKRHSEMTFQSSFTKFNDPLNAVLLDTWQYLMNNYFSADSPYQINVSNSLLEALILENKTNRFHSPSVLIEAKNSILALLRENFQLQGTFDPEKTSKRRRYTGIRSKILHLKRFI